MEVVRYEETDNHVVVGSTKSHAFAISTSAEFIEVLSKSLYSDPTLAAIREVMCNAWDAHISAGITDTPIEVSFTNNTVIIKDFGKGIPDDMIEEIYCTYGESTKRKESQTTGGFGLGSKSPFAIANLFTVKSCHNGTMTVYAVSRGSEETDFLPAMNVIVSLPTTETGLTVEIPIDVNEYSMHELNTLAQRVALLGEMYVLMSNSDGSVNIHEKTELGLANNDLGFVLTESRPTYRGPSSPGRIYVQYGAVVYPLTEHNHYESEYIKLYGALRVSVKLAGLPAFEGQYIILKAPPNSLTIAPSRETLTYTKYAVENIKEILTKTLETFDKQNPSIVHQAMTEVWDRFNKKIVLGSKLYTTLDFALKVRELDRGEYHENYDNLNTHYVPKTISNLDHFQRYFLAPRFRVKKGAFDSFYYKKARASAFHDSRHRKVFEYAYKHGRTKAKMQFWKLLYRDLYRKYGALTAKLCSFMYRDYNGYKKYANDIDSSYEWESFDPFKVYIGANKTSVRKAHRDREYTQRIFNELIVPANLKEVTPEDVHAYLSPLGYTTVPVFSMEEYKIARKATKTVSTGRKIGGYALLSEVVNSIGRLNYDDKFANAKRISDPEVYVVTVIRNHTKSIDHFNGAQAQQLIKYFPKTVLATNSNVGNNISVKHGIPSGLTAMRKLLEAKADDPTFISNVALTRVRTSEEEEPLYAYLAAIPEIAKEFGLGSLTTSSVISNDDAELWDSCDQFLNYSIRHKVNDLINTEARKLTTSLPNISVVKKAEPTISWLYRHSIAKYPAMNPNEQRMMVEILRIALKG